MTQYVEWAALGQVVLFGLLVGAGLPAVFALGVRALEGPGARAGKHAERSLLRTIVAWTCFGLVAAAAIGAVVFIASGGH
jgi:hypothetical protein